MKTFKLFQGMMVAALLATVPVTAVWAAHRSEAEAAISSAMAAHDEATAAGVASDETAALIKEAQDLIPSRQYTKAIQIAEKAKKQDEFAVSQKTSGSAGADEDKTRAESAIADAEAARKKASEVGGEWRDTGKMIKQAEDAVKAGEYAKAISLANTAKRQGELGYAQAMGEKDAGFPSFMVKQ
jgi:hypothetical protein